MSTLIDITGNKYGRLIVVRHTKNTSETSYWECLCSCGEVREVSKKSLRTGSTKSCGCLRREVTSARSKTHGMTNSLEMNSYRAAKDRCRRVNAENYERYGGRGIKFKFNSFDEFYSELGPRPGGHTLDRINSDGHYESGNVRWSTIADQNRNTRKNRMLTIKGETKCLSVWARESGIGRKTIARRLSKGWTHEQAVLTKPRGIPQ